MPQLHALVLAHLSQECNSPACARESVEPVLRRRGFKGRLHVAAQDEPLDAISLTTPARAMQGEFSLEWR